MRCFICLLLPAACASGAAPVDSAPPTPTMVVAPAAEPIAASAPTPATPSTTPPPAAAPQRKPLVLALVGDIAFARYGSHGTRPLTDGSPFPAVATLLAADAALANLETPMVPTLPDRPYISRGHRFGATAEHATWLHDAGFAAVSIANNHAIDLGALGLEHTAAMLRAAGVVPIGTPTPGSAAAIVETLEVDGWRIALIAATTWLNTTVPRGAPRPPLWRTRALPAALEPVITAARSDHDLVIVSLHWGAQFAADPDPGQRNAARKLVAAGADLIWGHHPHVLQGVEWIDGALVAYSLGNFVFPEIETRQDTRDSAVLRVCRSPDGAWHEVRLAPVHIVGTGRVQPQPATGGHARRIRKRLRSASARLGTAASDGSDGALIVPPPVTAADAGCSTAIATVTSAAAGS